MLLLFTHDGSVSVFGLNEFGNTAERSARGKLCLSGADRVADIGSEHVVLTVTELGDWDDAPIPCVKRTRVVRSPNTKHPLGGREDALHWGGLEIRWRCTVVWTWEGPTWNELVKGKITPKNGIHLVLS